MSDIGNILKEARESQNLSYDDVFNILRIQPKFLKAIEEERWEAMPSPTHVRGYIRKYAQHLSLDPNPILSRLASTSELYALTQQMQAVREPVLNYPVMPPQPETGTFFNPINAQDIHAEEGPDWIGRLVVLAFIIALGLLGWRFLPGLLNINVSELPLGSMESLTETVGDLMGQEAAAEPEIDTPSVQVSEPLTTTELVIPTSRTNGGSNGIQEVAESQEVEAEPIIIEPTRNLLPATLDVIDIEIEILENRTWIRVVVDDITMFEGQTNKGDVQTYSGEQSVNIRTGNGAGVNVLINEIDLGRLGDRGQVVDEVWTTTQ